MGFMLVVTGEHWVGDVLAGWIVAAAATAAVTAVERRTRRRAGVPASVGASPAGG
jgi:membrane-associated phospholipid phosphatase